MDDSVKPSVWRRLFKTTCKNIHESTRTLLTNASSSSSSSSEGCTSSSNALDETAIPALVVTSRGEASFWREVSHLLHKVADLLESAQAAKENGDYRECLRNYQEVIEKLKHEEGVVMLLANLSYACSRLAWRLQDANLAFSYAQDELHYSKLCGMTSAAHYHEIAEIAQYGLGESATALEYYQTALDLEFVSLNAAREKIVICEHCKSRQIKDLCEQHHTEALDIKNQIRETKECIGRIQFQFGNVADALRML